MRNYLVKELLNEMHEAQLDAIDNDSLSLLERIDIYTTVVDKAYENKLRDLELRRSIESYNDEIKILIDRITKVQLAALKNKNERLMFKCESKKANLINLMIYLQEKYL